MKTICIAPSKIEGSCPADYSMTDFTEIQNKNICSVSGPVCHVAIGMMGPQVNAIQKNKTFMNHASCPGCTHSDGSFAKVVFVLGWDKVWNTARKLSAYNWYRMNHPEDDDRKRIRYKCWTLASEGDGAASEELADTLLANAVNNSKDGI